MTKRLLITMAAIIGIITIPYMLGSITFYFIPDLLHHETNINALSIIFIGLAEVMILSLLFWLGKDLLFWIIKGEI